MAGIDKIYGSLAQYFELLAWLQANLPEGVRYLYHYAEDNADFQNMPISNFPEWIDRRLLKECPLRWVTDGIKDQYGLMEKPTKPKYHRSRSYK